MFLLSLSVSTDQPDTAWEESPETVPNLGPRVVFLGAVWMEQNGRHYVISGRCLACGVHGVFNTLGVHPVRRHGTQLMTRIRRGQEGSCGNSEHSPGTHPLLAVSGAEHQGSGDVTLTAEDLPRGDRENG